MLDLKTTGAVAGRLVLVNCVWFTTCDDKHHEFDEDLLALLRNDTHVFNVFFQRDNAKKNAAKSFAKHALSAVKGLYYSTDEFATADSDDMLLLRRYITDGTNNAVGALVGVEARDIIMQSYKGIYLMIKNKDSMLEEGMDLLTAGAGLAARTELLKNGLYKGPLSD